MNLLRSGFGFWTDHVSDVDDLGLNFSRRRFKEFKELAAVLVQPFVRWW